MATTFRKAQWIGLGLTSVLAILGIMYYLIVIPQSLAVLNTDAIIFTSPDEGAVFNVNDSVMFIVIFNPSVLEGQATDYYVLAKSSEKIFFQEEATGLAYITAFTLTRDFVADASAQSLTIRAEMTIGSEVYYNELTVTVIDPEMTTEVTTDMTTSYDTTGFGLPLFLLILVVIGIQQRKQDKQWRRMR